MINKEPLAQFIYKPTSSTEKILPWKHWEFITLAMYIEERGWVKAKIIWPVADILTNSG